jgi:hypothetical protein
MTGLRKGTTFVSSNVLTNPVDLEHLSQEDGTALPPSRRRLPLHGMASICWTRMLRICPLWDTTVASSRKIGVSESARRGVCT